MHDDGVPYFFFFFFFFFSILFLSILLGEGREGVYLQYCNNKKEIKKIEKKITLLFTHNIALLFFSFLRLDEIEFRVRDLGM